MAIVTALKDATRAAANQAADAGMVALRTMNDQKVPESAGMVAGSRISDGVSSLVEGGLRRAGLDGSAAPVADAATAASGIATAFAGSLLERLSLRLGSEPLREAAMAAASAVKGAGAGTVAGEVMEQTGKAAAKVV